MKPWQLLAVLTLAVLTAALGACASAPPAVKTAAAPAAANAAARVIISRDFGRTILKDKTLEIDPKSNAMTALQQVSQLETGYGGSFVNGIDGLRSTYSGLKSSPQDWFYYVNGLVANTGALEYPLLNGDIQQWDYHFWGFRQMIPAVVGHFPQPFLSGCRGKIFPTLVVYQSGWQKSAEEIQNCLLAAGVKAVQTRPAEQLSETEKAGSNLILLAGPQNPLVAEVNKEWKRLGFFAYFDNYDLVAVDSAGKIQARYGENTGVIQATQNPWNPEGIGAGENTLWLVSGSDEGGIRLAVNGVIQKTSVLPFAYGVIVRQNEVLKLP